MIFEHSLASILLYVLSPYSCIQTSAIATQDILADFGRNPNVRGELDHQTSTATTLNSDRHPSVPTEVETDSSYKP